MEAAQTSNRPRLHCRQNGRDQEGEQEEMRNLTRYYLRLREEKGQTLAEYALILGLIAVVTITAVTLLGNHVSSLMNTVANSI